MNEDEILSRFFEDPGVVRRDMEEREDLRRSQGGGMRGEGDGALAGGEGRMRVRFGRRGLVRKPVVVDEERKLNAEAVRRFEGASAAGRWEMLGDQEGGRRMRSILFWEYRPAPAYGAGHELVDDGLLAKVTPGGVTWASVLEKTGHAGWARHAVRLDNEGEGQRGSGTVFGDGRVLTAAHVVHGPGYLFGRGKGGRTSGEVEGRAGFDWLGKKEGDVNGDGGKRVELVLGRGAYEETGELDIAWLREVAGWREKLDGTEFAGVEGLVVHGRKPAFDLRGRRVAVIGHPGRPVAGSEDAAVAARVYEDGVYGVKRILPGTLHWKNPLVQWDGVWWLQHDCSTLGGTSGGVLMDLESGAVLGVHVSGRPGSGVEDRNLAVPAWEVKGWGSGVRIWEEGEV